MTEPRKIGIEVDIVNNGSVIDKTVIELLRSAGYAVVPLRPTDEMVKVGAPFCFIVPNGTVEASLADARDCYQAMVELGCL